MKYPGNMIRIFVPDTDPGPDLDFLPIPDPGVKKAPDPRSETLFVCDTGTGA